MFLDPWFQHKLTSEQRIDATNHLKAIWDRLSEFDSTLASTPNSILSQSENHFFDEEDELDANKKRTRRSAVLE